MIEKLETREPAWSQIKDIVQEALLSEFNSKSMHPRDAAIVFADQAKKFRNALLSVDLIMKHVDGELIEAMPEEVQVVDPERIEP